MELYEYSAHELAKMYRNKETTVVEVVESIYKRIEEKDPEIKAYISLDKENALKQAEEIQKEFDAVCQRLWNCLADGGYHPSVSFADSSPQGEP